MKYTTIPHTDLQVSKICLGTMTWGNQNSPAEGFEQMDYALEAGVNFLIQPNFIQSQPLQTPMPKQSVL